MANFRRPKTTIKFTTFTTHFTTHLPSKNHVLHPFFLNPPAKTHLYLRFKKIRQDSSLRKTNQLVEGVGSVGVVGDSEACGVSAVAAWVADASASDA